MNDIIKYVIMFFFYSFAGWCLESLYCSIGEKRLINRGFLTGPLCPIYGTAAIVLVVLIYNPFKDNLLIVFLLGILLCDIVEYLTSLIMEKLFAARWWDYTYELFNIAGRICLKHSLYWGVISVVFVKVIHPGVENLYAKIDVKYLIYILAAILVVFVLDVINAVRKALDIRKLQIKLNSILEVLSSTLSEVKDTIEDKYEVVHSLAQKQADRVADFKYQLEDTVYQLDVRLTRRNKKKNDDKKSLSSRLFYDNPNFERRTRIKLKNIQSMIDDIKANVFESEDMQ